MTDAAVITGTYSDFRLVKTRGVVQLVVEVPISQSARALEIFGMPNPASEIPVALARLNPPTSPPAAAQGSPSPPSTPETPNSPRASQAGGAKRDSLTYRAVMLCNDATFQYWMGVSGRPETAAQDTARHLRDRLGIQSRAELDHDEVAAQKFVALETRFLIAAGRLPDPRG